MTTCHGATVMYPVTSGSAGDVGTFETLNLRQGNFVFGFFMDGEDGQQPVIMGVIGYNNYTAIMAEIPDAKFVPFTDLNSSRGQNVPVYVRKVVPDPGDLFPSSINGTIINNRRGNSTTQQYTSKRYIKQ